MLTMNKIFKIFLTICILFITFLAIYLSPREYSLEYEKDNVIITEYYSKIEDYYKLSFNYKNRVYESIVFDKYSTNRKLIDNIKIVEVGEIVCLIPKSEELKTYPLCKNSDENVNYHLVDELKEKVDEELYKNLVSKEFEYNNVKVNTLNDKTYLIWNYSGLDIISKSRKETINFFETDVYDTSLAYLLNDFFIIPDYENDYRFNKMYLYNLKRDMLRGWELNDYLYFDSYILGHKNKSLYIFDKKNKKEYELVPHKEKMRVVSPKIIVNGEWENISTQKLINEVTFSEKTLIKYEIINNNLYKVLDDYKELISSKNVKYIVASNEKEVYYLVDDSLYLFSMDYGEVKLMSYFEWEFNFENKIFVY